MARPKVTEEDNVIETWEVTTGATVWVSTYDRREDQYKKTRVGGRAGTRRLHISRDDRKYNQESVVEEMVGHDPFTNGTLRLLDASTRDDTLNQRYHLSTEDLLALLEVKEEDLFKTEITEITSELILRRLYGLAEKHAQVWQLEFIRQVIDDRYKAGGTQRTVREILAAGEKLTSAL